jgi:MFS family permease
MGSELRALREVFRNPALRRLMVAWLFTNVGIWGSGLALAIYTYGRAGASAVGVIGLLRTLPGAPAAPFLALVADRLSRRSVMLGSAVARAATLALVAAAIAADAPLGVIYALVVAFAAVGVAYRPAMAALLPQVARTPGELSAANVASGMALNVGFLVGSLAGGILLSATSAGTAFFVLAAFFALAIPPLLLVERDERPEDEHEEDQVNEVVEGLRLVRADSSLREVAVLGGFLLLIDGAMDVLMVVAALSYLDLGEAGAGYLSTTWAAGCIAGGPIVLVLLSRGRLLTGLTLGSFVLGGSMALFGVVPSVIAAFIGLFVFGIGQGLVEIAADTLRQRLAPDHVLARVFGVQETIDVVAAAIGALAAGLLVDWIGGQAALVVVGAVMPALVLLRSARLNRLESGAPAPGREYNLVRGHRIFAPLPVATNEWLARALDEVRPAPGAEVITQGDPGDRFYLIEEGSVDVFENGELRRTMGPGEGFGEIALLRDVPRTATVRAREGVVLLALDRDEFLEAVTGQSRSARAADALAEHHLGSAEAPEDPAGPLGETP